MKTKIIFLFSSLAIIGVFLILNSCTKDKENTNLVIDIDGNVYHTIAIGEQVWIVENLRTTHYANGTALPLVAGKDNWNALTEQSKGYCWYYDDSITQCYIWCLIHMDSRNKRGRKQFN